MRSTRLSPRPTKANETRTTANPLIGSGIFRRFQVEFMLGEVG